MEKSLLALPPHEQAEALKKSRLSDLIENKGLFARMCEAAVILFQDEKLQKCDEYSVMGALYKAVTMGFRLEREFGECYLIPRNVNVGTKEKPVYKSVCSFQIGYKGWKALALQSGHVAFLEAHEVYREDIFDYEYGTNQFIKHKPANETTGETINFYARAKLANGFECFQVINKQDAERSRTHSEEQYDWVNKQKIYSKDKPKGIWAKHYAAMALRVPIKRVCAMLPLTPAIENAMLSDGSVTYYKNSDGTTVTISPTEVEEKAEQLPDDQMAIPATIEKIYYENLDYLSLETEFEKVKTLWSNQDPNTPHMVYKPYVKMFYEAAAKTAQTTDELHAFHALTPKSWKTSEELKTIFSERAKQLKDGKPAEV